MSDGIQPLAEGPRGDAMGPRTHATVDARVLFGIIGLLVGLIIGWLLRPSNTGGAQISIKDFLNPAAPVRDLAVETGRFLLMCLVGGTVIGAVVGFVFAQMQRATIEVPAYFAHLIKNHDDFVGGIVLIAIGLFAFWASADLPGMRGFAFGPGTAPRLFAGLLCAFGVAVLAMGFFTTPPERADPVEFRTWRDTVVGLFANPFVFVALYIAFMAVLMLVEWVGLRAAAAAAAATGAGARSAAKDVQQFMLILAGISWLVLITFASLRGAAIGHRWLAFFPLAGAFCAIFSVLTWVPYLSMAFNVICLVLGVVLPSRTGHTGAFSMPILLTLPARVRGPIFVTASILSFAAMIRPLGLVVASFLTFVIAAIGSRETKWRESLPMAIGMTAFCTFLFPYALNLPFQMWPPFVVSFWNALWL
jgi:hypothetical protein